MAKNKIVYPDPKFFRAKDDINWKAQGENKKIKTEVSDLLVNGIVGK